MEVSENIFLTGLIGVVVFFAVIRILNDVIESIAVKGALLAGLALSICSVIGSVLYVIWA